MSTRKSRKSTSSKAKSRSKSNPAVTPVAVEATIPVEAREEAINTAAQQEVPKPRRSRKAKPVEAPAPVETIPPVEAAPAVEITEIAKLTGPKLTETYNSLVPVANGLGIAWAKHHSSLFESKAKGVKQVTKLQAAIAHAKLQAAIAQAQAQAVAQ